MEAGLGGHYDATMAMPVQAVCFTPIGMDHEKILGPTRTDIASAGHKSQAMRPGVPAFTAPQEAEALDCLLRTAQEKGAELRETASLPFPQSALGLAGGTSAGDARLAIAVWTGSPISTIGRICPITPKGWLPRTSPDGSSASRPDACRP